MNEEVVTTWLENLRSGKYQQGTGYLRQRNAAGKEMFCCLGVLCDMHNRERWQEVDHGAWEYDGQFPSMEMPPKDVLRWAGVPDGLASELAECNDSGETFSELADMIERNLHKSQEKLEELYGG